MKRKEEFMKFGRLKQQIHNKMEVVQMPQIDKSLAPKSKRRVVEFNV